MNEKNRPRNVILAIYCAIASYCVGLISVPSYWQQGVEKYGLINQIFLFLIPFILFFGLYYLIWLRKNWARIILLILLGLSFGGYVCLLYTSPSPRDQRGSRMPSSA